MGGGKVVESVFASEGCADAFRAVLDRQPIGVALLSVPGFVFEYVNPAFQAFAPEMEMVGRPNAEVFPDLSWLGAPVLSALKETGKPWRAEDATYRIRRTPNGPLETVVVSFVVSPLRIGGGFHLLVTVTETTEQSRLRQQLQESQARLGQILDNVRIGFAGIGWDWRITYINRQAASDIGVEPEQCLGREVWAAFPEWFGEAFERYYRVAMDGRTETRFEVMRGPSGPAFEVSAYPTSEGIAIVANDVTERERLLERQREASENVQRALESEQRLRKISDGLNEIQRLLTSTLDLDEILRRVNKSAAEMVHADAASVGLFEDDHFVVRGVYGLPEEFFGRRLDAGRDGLARSLRETGEPVVVADAVGDPRADAGLTRRFGLRSILAVPFSVKGEVIGSITFFCLHYPQAFSDEDVDSARKVAAILSLALENSRLFDVERRQLEFAEILDDVNRTIHSSLDYDEVMQRSLEQCAKTLGARAGGVFVGSEGVSEARYVFGFPKFLLGRRFAAKDFPFAQAMEETKEPVAIGPAEMSTLMNPYLARLFRARSVLAIPLLTRGALTGGIGLVFGEPHEFTSLEIDFARRLGASISLAIENAELYRRQERVADTLQEALLTLPEHMQGLEFGHAYHSATEAAKVGGDFYDLFELEHDMVGLTMGDIAGKGLDAAVLTSLVKNAIRAQAMEAGKSPADVMTIVNEVLLRASEPDAFATVYFGIMDLHEGRLVYCNAGHTAAAILRRGGAVEKLSSNSPLVGAFPDQLFEDSEIRLSPGDLLFMYTDGLIEARSGDELFGEERLFDLLGHVSGHPDGIVEGVLEEVVAFAGGSLSDDVAILAVKRH